MPLESGETGELFNSTARPQRCLPFHFAGTAAWRRGRRYRQFLGAGAQEKPVHRFLQPGGCHSRFFRLPACTQKLKNRTEVAVKPGVTELFTLLLKRNDTRAIQVGVQQQPRAVLIIADFPEIHEYVELILLQFHVQSLFMQFTRRAEILQSLGLVTKCNIAPGFICCGERLCQRGPGQSPPLGFAGDRKGC